MTPAGPILESIRRACRPGTWSTGVNLVRTGSVSIESQTGDEIVLRVRAPGRPVAPTVVLYPTMDEWECDCPSRIQPCEHVAAAAIALAQAGEQGDQAPALATPAYRKVLYRFVKVEGGLKLTRALALPDGSEAPLDGTLSALLSKPSEASTLQPEEADLQADRLLETSARGVLAPSKVEALMRVLLGCPRLSLDGKPVTISEEEILPHASIVDRGQDVVLTIRRDPRISDVVSAGVALCGDVLARLGETELGGAWMQNFPFVRVFGPRELAEVATKLLPDLARRMPVDVQSRRVPSVVRNVPPRVVLQLDHVGAGSLSALPTLVYGSPPTVRIDDGRTTYLGGAVPVRDTAAEKRVLESLREQLGLLPGRRTTFSGPDAAVFARKLEKWRGDLTGDAAALMSPNVRLTPRLAVQTLLQSGDGAGNDLPPGFRFDLTFEVEGTAGGRGPAPGQTVDASAVVRAWREGLGLVPLDGGGWAPLPSGWLQRHGQRLADLLAARDPDGRVAAHAAPALAGLCHELEQPSPPALDRLAALVDGFDQLPPSPLPSDLNATLRAYQRQGVDWLAFLRSAGLGGVLADDMGLGKTLQAICALARPALVVAPTSVLHGWQSELARFRPSLRVCLYHGTDRTLDEAADVVITSYALLRLDADRLGARQWATVVLDEAQAIKNPDSQVARAAYALKAGFRLALTGTPIENRLEELWSLMHFANRGLLGGRREFDDATTRPVAMGDQRALENLRRRLRPFVLRRLKRDVAPELPPRTELTMRIQLDERERAVYDAVRAASRADVVALMNGGGNVMAALEALLRLRQAACHPSLVPGQKADSSSKVEALTDALETAVADGHKALVFSQWTSLLDLIEPALTAAQIPFVRLDGSTRDRAGVVNRFQATDGPPVMLVSLKAGGSGLNLTAADHVFLCDPWWNPAVEAQAADRAHRIGQERPVMVYRMVTADTVEERILALQEHKRALVEAALGDGAAAGGLSREDLLALLA